MDDLIGTPFKLGGRDLKGLDCYGLVLEVARRHGYELPDYTSPEQFSEISAVISTNLQTWTPCEKKPGAMVIIKVPRNLHCGVVIGPDQFLHAWADSGGVCAERLSDWSRRIVGFYEYRAAGKG